MTPDMGATAASARRTVYELARTSTLEGWWIWALLIGALLALLFVCIRFYRRDTDEQPKPIQAALISLRVLTIVALLFFFFDMQRRTERMITRPSEVAILVDTSQSMSLPADTGTTAESRTDRIARVLQDTDLLEQLGQQHRVSVYGFGNQAEPQILEVRGGTVATGAESDETQAANDYSTLAIVAALLVVIGVLLSATALLFGAAGRAESVGWWIVGSMATLIPGMILLGSVYCIRSEDPLVEILRLDDAQRDDQQPDISEPAAEPDTGEPDSGDADATPVKVSDWNQEVAASAPQSRIGDAIRGVLATHDPSTLAGVVLATDGQNNGGVETLTALAPARRAEVAIFPLGLGSSDAPVNVRVVDLNAPRRVYPGDKFTVSAVLQGSGPQPLDVEVQLLDGLDDAAASGSGDAPTADLPRNVVDSQRVEVKSDGTMTAIRFEVEPESVGRRRLAIRVVAPPKDQNRSDDARDARYEVVSRKLRVMAIAGGPTREYRFVRNLLYRDKSVELHAWLQTGRPGMSQDADVLLQSFPETVEELFEYDVIAMFDPDWSEFTLEQLNMIDRWLSQQAGGLVLVAGPVYHPQWIRKRTDPRVPKIAEFFPVDLSNRASSIVSGRQGGTSAWPLKFTTESQRSEFLWIAEDATSSFEVWDQFGGVYDYVDVKSAKPGAKVYAYFSDPTTEIGDSLPVYLASQFYGAGRIYFQGSGEMWRLRGESDSYFESYYTKLFRWVSEGRLLRDSNRGILMVDSARAQVGDTITVRAVLTDEQFEPLNVPDVPAKLLAPGGRIVDLRLLPLEGEARPGTYGTRYIVREAGSFEIRLTLGDALKEQVLRQSVQVRLPTSELERPRRNDTDLQQMAATTGGEYLPINNDTPDEAIASQLVSWLQPQPQTTILPGSPDLDFTRRRNAVLMWLIATLLTMEWVIRRLHRLA